MDKINLYKEGIISFNTKNNYKKYNTINLSEYSQNYDYLIGVLFLVEINRYCKQNKITMHGYYISQSLINLFIKFNLEQINTIDVINFYKNLFANINYINERGNMPINIKNSINNNIANLMEEITQYLESFITNKNLNDFFYIILTIAKFLGTGEISNDQNLYKLGEYYAGIFNICTTINKTNNINQIIFDEYLSFKNKLKYSISFMQINSERIDEILAYLDSILMFRLESIQ